MSTGDINSSISRMCIADRQFLHVIIYCKELCYYIMMLWIASWYSVTELCAFKKGS